MRLLPGARARAALALALGGAAVALAGCASVPASPTGADGHAPTTASPGTGLTSAAKLTPRQRAEADTKALFAAFAVPPGARALSRAPEVAGGVLRQVSQQPESPDLLDTAGWWLVPGSPKQVLAWEKKHLPHRLAHSESGSYGAGPATVWMDGYDLPAVYGVLDQRSLLVQAVADGQQTALRVDAQEVYTPARPASEKVPATSRAVTIAANPGSRPDAKVPAPPAPVTITDPAKVRRLVKLVNGQPLTVPEVFSCPASFGSTLTLTFRTAPGKPALAVATEQLTGCPRLDFTLGGKRQPELASIDGKRILKIAGLSWKVSGA